MSIEFYEEALLHLGLDENDEKLHNYLYKNGYDINPVKTAWCAAFVGAVLNSCRYEGTHSLLARSYLKWGIHVPIEDIQCGDIVVLKRGILPWQGHIGFKCTSSWDNTSSWDKGRLRIIGGNQDNKVCVKEYNISDVLGVRREGK